MTDTHKVISNLTMPEKVSLFKELYGEIAGCGTDGDTELAHVNPFEVRMLKYYGGSGTVNTTTGLREFKSGGGGGSPPPPASSQTVSQTSEFPQEIRPFIKDILQEGKGEFGREKEEGYLRFPGAQLAGFTPEQQAAFDTGRQQFTGLAGTPLAQASTYYQPALAATALGTSEIGTGDIQRRMDPFLQNVVDIAKREATRDEDVASQQRAAQAVGAGSFGGSRQAIVEAEAERNLAERLGDIQARGLSSAFQNAQRAAEQQRAREMAGGRQFAALGDITGTRARSDLAGLSGIGEVQQQRQQQALDIARREFEEEKAFPQTALQRYASLIRGFPLSPNQQQVITTRERPPSFSSQLIGAGLGAAGTYGMFGGFNPTNSSTGGLVGLANGGVVGAKGGGFPKQVSSSTAQPQASQGTLPTGGGKAGHSTFLRVLMMNPEIAKKFKDKFGLTVDASGNWKRATNQVAQQTQQPFANINLGNYVKTKNDGGLLSVVKARVGKTLSLRDRLDPSYQMMENPDFTLEDLENIQSGDHVDSEAEVTEAEPVVSEVVEPDVNDISSTVQEYKATYPTIDFSRLEGQLDSLKGLFTTLGTERSAVTDLFDDLPSTAERRKELEEYYDKRGKTIAARGGQDMAMGLLAAAPHFFVPGRSTGESAVAAAGAALPIIGEGRKAQREAEDLLAEGQRAELLDLPLKTIQQRIAKLELDKQGVTDQATLFNLEQQIGQLRVAESRNIAEMQAASAAMYGPRAASSAPPDRATIAEDILLGYVGGIKVPSNKKIAGIASDIAWQKARRWAATEYERTGVHPSTYEQEEYIIKDIQEQYKTDWKEANKRLRRSSNNQTQNPEDGDPTSSNTAASSLEAAQRLADQLDLPENSGPPGSL
jgi:hypothetical protein